MKAGRGDPARRAGRAMGDCVMSGHSFTRRAAIAACAAFALAGHAALSQSGREVRNIRVDVAPLRANAGDPTATWVEEELPRRLARPWPAADAERRHADGQDRLSDIGAEHRGHYPRRLVARQHHRGGDDRKRAMAGAGDDQLCGLADRSDHDRTVQSLSGVAARAGADVLDRQRPRRLTSKRGFAPLHWLRVSATMRGTSSSVTGANMLLLSDDDGRPGNSPTPQTRGLTPPRGPSPEPKPARAAPPPQSA